MPSECHFFEDIYARRQELGTLSSAATRSQVFERLATMYGRYNQNEDQERINRLFADPIIRQQVEASFYDYRSILNTFIGVQMQSSKKVRWGNNAPKDLFHINEILSLYPHAKFIMCVRDVRDFLLSYKDRWKVTTAGHRARLRELYHPIITSLLWNSSMRHLISLTAKMPAASWMVIKYENLVRDPECLTRQMCAFLGETFEPAMLNVSTHNSSEAVQLGGIFTSSVGKWRGRLTSEEVFIAQWVNRSEMLRLGYSLEKQKAILVRIAMILASSPYALFRALAANKDKRGPLVPYLAKRMAALL
jgi:hypothetical protein